MTNEKKVEIYEENLDEVAGGNNVKKGIAVAAAIIAGTIVGYKTYNTTMNALNESDGTSKKGGNENKGGGNGNTNNSISGTRNKSYQQSKEINFGGNSNVSL